MDALAYRATTEEAVGVRRRHRYHAPPVTYLWGASSTYLNVGWGVRLVSQCPGTGPFKPALPHPYFAIGGNAKLDVHP